MKVYFQKIHPDAKLPKQAHPTDAGYDVYAALDQPLIIPPGGQAVIDSGWKVGIQPFALVSEKLDEMYSADIVYLGDGNKALQMFAKFVWILDVRSRSGWAAKHRVFVTNSPGTVDQNYRGPLKVILYNGGDEDFVVDPGDRIAQLVVTKAYLPEFVEVEELDETDRGEGGFGHTGAK